MSQLRKLAGQTAYYGISSILGRVLNFLLLPIWTARLVTEEYGSVTYLYTYLALGLVIYTFGMETAFFRFSRKIDARQAYHNAATAVLLVSGLLSGLLYVGAPGIARWLDKGIQTEYIQYMAAILFIDAVVAIPFAKLRLEERPLKFALIKTGVITITILLNLLFIIVFPDILQGKYLSSLSGFVESFYKTDYGVGYIFQVNLMANLLYIPFLWSEFKSLRLRIHWPTFKPMLNYGLPIFLMGLGGIFNEQGYSLIMIELLGESELGVFSSAVKLSVIMMLGIQAFRYAAEPFFFNHAENREAPALFAKIMHYFIVFNIFMMVAVALNIDLISDLFLRKPEYKQALYVLPVLLLAKLLYGIYVNLSVWFKLKDKTIFGTYFALIGAVVTLAGNVLLIPLLGYYGSAFASLLCYAVMSFLCYQKGKSEFAIPYRFKPLAGYLLLAMGVIYGVEFIQLTNGWLSYGLDLFVTLIFAVFMYLREGKSLNYKTVSNPTR
ncbi:oligosaccharide flippase family protein [Roseivirga thermotolerans]|uniref:Polysaccharide biosynthesis protein n=1 Tax=Roseivirga thermotolerans TaxID=1758176 RepID=A0ABQ3I5S3_9BACT|nr:oligosaccharide flippase family protein [Roseivirga thermotolerans]GHE59006.1 polysaccharide biosynthesis protein [Roseivirga thermotolerans]